MYAYAAWNVDASQILSRRELALMLAERTNEASINCRSLSMRLSTLRRHPQRYQLRSAGAPLEEKAANSGAAGLDAARAMLARIGASSGV